MHEGLTLSPSLLCLRLLLPDLKGVAHCHSQGVLHCDLDLESAQGACLMLPAQKLRCRIEMLCQNHHQCHGDRLSMF
ncbi:hypothetical protein Fmac_015631 [Flemingia macrophylla]|uniref:Secreted protein n=1 Tax=Flemingia macrophylla TaxID=520843 RepID=A0ABD1MF45_9FABA